MTLVLAAAATDTGGPIATLIQQILWPVILPGSVATLLLLVLWRPWRREPDLEAEAGAAWGFPLVVGGAIIVAFASQEWPAAFPFPQRWQWIAVLAAACTLLGVLAAAIRSPVTSLMVSAGGAAIATGRLIDYGPLAEGIGRVPLALAAGGLVLVMEPLAVRRRGFALPAAAWMAFTGLSVAALHAGFAKLSLIAAGASAAAGAGVVVGMLQPRLSLARGAMTVLAPMFVVLLATAWAYEGRRELGPWPWILLAAVPPLAWAGLLLAPADGPAATPRRRFIAGSTGVLLPLLAMLGAVALTIANAAPADDGSGEPAYDTSIYGG